MDNIEDNIDSATPTYNSNNQREENGNGQHEYISPVDADEFPIIASTGFYSTEDSTGTYSFNLDFDRVRKCGFNVVIAGMYFKAVGNAFIADLADKAGLKIQAGNTWYYRSDGEVKQFVFGCSPFDAVSVWLYKDEPVESQFDELAGPYKTLYKVDSESEGKERRMVDTNLLPGFEETTLKGLFEGKTIEETQFVKSYINPFEEMFMPGVWSYDAYPITENAWGINMWVHAYRGFYGNLIFFACRTYDHFINGNKYNGRPFWAYVESLSAKKLNADNVLAPRFPKAKEVFMRYEAFTALAFGAQGIVYWTYGDRESNGAEVYYGALIDKDGNPTDAWYAAQKVNREIHALKDVFLGCKLVEVWFSRKLPAKAPDKAFKASDLKWFSNADAAKFLYVPDITINQDKGTIYVDDNDQDFGGVGIAATKIRKEIKHADGSTETKYYKIFLNQDFENPTRVKFTVNSGKVYNILPDVESAARKFESKENMDEPIKPVRIHVPQYAPLNITIQPGGYVIFEVPN